MVKCNRIAAVIARRFAGCFLAGLMLPRIACPAAPPPIDNYEPGPDSKPQPGVPVGKTFSFKFNESKIFPGTERDITVYVPAEYKADRPACVYVGFDNLGFNAPVVFDNLIHKGEIPVLIGIGVSPGTVPSTDGGRDPRFNRSIEFDGLSDSLARCVVEEIFPEVEKRKTTTGLPIYLSHDPNDRCTGGGSTGGIAAFTCAWTRPDHFRRVFSAIGTFVSMRGGDRYPVLIRETDPKPIRVFQQDGSNDEWMGGPEVGDWWIGNQSVERALTFAGYEHTHSWGDGPHGGKHGTAIFPDAMRFLWKDWPQRVEPHPAQSGNVMLRWVSDPVASWEAIPEAGNACEDLAVDPKGELYFHDIAASTTRKLGLDGAIADAGTIQTQAKLAFAANGRQLQLDVLNKPYVALASNGNMYAAETATGKVWLIRSDRSRLLLDQNLKQPTGIALSPDGLWLAVMQRQSHTGYSYRVKPDGSVDARQNFYWLHVPDTDDDSGAGGICFDREGRLYVSTRMGIQVLDRNGRSRAILPLPAGGASAVSFGGARFDTLFAVSGGQLFQRKMKALGASPFDPPIKLPPWGAG